MNQGQVVASQVSGDDTTIVKCYRQVSGISMSSVNVSGMYLSSDSMTG